MTDSNRQPSPRQGVTLPIELISLYIGKPIGIRTLTNYFGDNRATITPSTNHTISISTYLIVIYN